MNSLLELNIADLTPPYFQDNLEPKTVFELLGRHGRDEITLFYASIIGAHERTIQHHVAQEDWTKALQALSKQVRLSLLICQSHIR